MSERDMPHVGTQASGAVFANALSTGLLWGIAAGAAIPTAFATFLWLDRGATAPDVRVLFDTFFWMAAVATLLAVFPIGPVAGLIGWQLYRRGLVARWMYASAGAFAAFFAPVLFFVMSPMLTGTWHWNVAALKVGPTLMLSLAFMIVGWFAGYMGGGVLRRAAGS